MLCKKHWKIKKEIRAIRKKHNKQKISFIISKIEEYYDNNDVIIDTEEYLSRLSRLTYSSFVEENMKMGITNGLLLWIIFDQIIEPNATSIMAKFNSNWTIIEKSLYLLIVSIFYIFIITGVFGIIYFLFLRFSDKQSFSTYLDQYEKKIIEKKLEKRKLLK